jgi:hypothetical protein
MQADLHTSSNTATSLENLVKLTPFLTATILAISITYDSAYLWALGLSLSDIPSSISEHIRSALLWSPIILFLLMGLFIIFIITLKPINISTAKEEVTFIQKHEIKFIVLFAILLLALIGYLIVFANEKQFIFILISLVWFLTVFGFMMNKQYQKIKKPIFVLIFLTAPVLLCLFGFYGYDSGRRIFNQNKPHWEYIIKKDDKEISINVNGQRRFTEFTIAILSDKKILIIQNSNIVSMKSL